MITSMLLLIFLAKTRALASENCICVPYWQCKEDYSGLVEDGIDIIDIRVLKDGKDDEAAPCTGDFDVCCHIECGRRNVKKPEHLHAEEEGISPALSPRILGDDNEADFAEFPWMLAILEKRIYKCGASLIHPQVALTAAHCVQPFGNYKVRAGEWNWNTLDEPLPYQDRLSTKIIIHQRYNPFSLINDVALIILESPFKFSENVGVVCLPKSTKFRNTMCTASGWGKNSYHKGTYQSTLKKTDLPLVPRNRCLKILQEERLGPYFKLHNSFICAGAEAKRDTCKGDGGSPLVCPIKELNGRYEQTGIVSWGLTCGLKNTPGVYANVALHMQWIDYNMEMYGFDTNIYKY